MFQQLRDSLRSRPIRHVAIDARRPRRTRQPRVESLEGRAMCDGAASTFTNAAAATSSTTISFDG